MEVMAIPRLKNSSKFRSDNLKTISYEKSFFRPYPSKSFISRSSCPDVPATLLKKRLWHRCFSVNFAKFVRAPFLTEHLWLLVKCGVTDIGLSDHGLIYCTREISRLREDHINKKSSFRSNIIWLIFLNKNCQS